MTEDDMVVKLKSEDINVFVFKPYPPISILYKNKMISFANIDHVKEVHSILTKVLEEL